MNMIKRCRNTFQRYSNTTSTSSRCYYHFSLGLVLVEHKLVALERNLEVDIPEVDNLEVDILEVGSLEVGSLVAIK